MSKPTNGEDRTGFYAPDWRAVVWASVIAGLVFAGLEMALVWAVDGMSPWAPLRMIGAIGLGAGRR